MAANSLHTSRVQWSRTGPGTTDPSRCHNKLNYRNKCWVKTSPDQKPRSADGRPPRHKVLLPSAQQQLGPPGPTSGLCWCWWVLTRVYTAGTPRWWFRCVFLHWSLDWLINKVCNKQFHNKLDSKNDSNSNLTTEHFFTNSYKQSIHMDTDTSVIIIIIWLQHIHHPFRRQ